MSTVWIPGAVSATFKKLPLSPEEILRLLADCRLQAVEWSENAHVQPDDPEGAARLGQLTRQAGLRVAAYGSYFRLGENADPAPAFARSLRSASALGAPVIRIWAGTLPSAQVGDALFDALAREAALVAGMAAEQHIRVAFEWHKNTLTDTNASAHRLLQRADHANLYCLWQPTVALTPQERVEGIRLMAPQLLNFHVYSWPQGKRGPLDAAEWQTYLQAADLGGEHCALLEFVRDDSVDQFRADAQTLCNLLEGGLNHG